MLMPQTPYSFDVRASVRYGTVPGAPSWEAGLFLDLLLPRPAPPEPVPAVVYIHGGGWRNGDKCAGMYPWYSPLMAANGFVAVNLGYRLTGQAPFPAQLHDAKAAIRWLRAHADQYGIDPERIGVWGDSAGGHLAALLGVSGNVAELEGSSGTPEHSSAVQAVVARCAVLDFTSSEEEFAAQNISEFLVPLFGGPLPDRRELLKQASPIAHADAAAPPFLIVHGTEDETVPFTQVERATKAMREQGVDVTLHPIRGAYHNLLPDIDLPLANEPWATLGKYALEFFDQNLRSR